MGIKNLMNTLWDLYIIDFHLFSSKVVVIMIYGIIYKFYSMMENSDKFLQFMLN